MFDRAMGGVFHLQQKEKQASEKGRNEILVIVSWKFSAPITEGKKVLYHRPLLHPFQPFSKMLAVQLTTTSTHKPNDK